MGEYERAFQQLFTALNDAGVDYVVVGGIAAQAHGALRPTQDADIVLDHSPENFNRFRTTMTSLGAWLVNLPPLGIEYMRNNPAEAWSCIEDDELAGRFHQIAWAQRGRLDLMSEVAGPDDATWTYKDLAPSAQTVRYENALIKVVDRDRLIAAKQATGRPKDLEVIAELRNSPVSEKRTCRSPRPERQPGDEQDR